MRVRLGKFARRGIEIELGPDLEAGVSAALEYCAEQIVRGRASIGLPSFLGEPPRDATTDAELAVAPHVEKALKLEVSRRGIPLDRLINHAVIVYLARIDELQAPA